MGRGYRPVARDQRQFLNRIALAAAILAGAGGAVAAEQDVPRAAACFALAVLAAIVADMLRPGRPSYR